MITVVNKHWHKPTENDVYCGRGSPVGNPYSHLPSSVPGVTKVSSREEAIEQTAELVIYYSSAKALEKMGIDLSDTPAVAEPAQDQLPKPFGHTSGYCTPPKNWKRNA